QTKRHRRAGGSVLLSAVQMIRWRADRPNLPETIGTPTQKGGTMRRSLIFSFVIALTVAVPLTILADRRGFEEQAARALIAEQAAVSGSKCPLAPRVIDETDISLLSICLSYGMD